MFWSKAYKSAAILIAALGLSSAAYAAHGGKHSHEAPVPGSPAAVVETPAFKVYDSAMLGCVQSVLQVNPLEAAQSGDTQALNMDRDDIEGIQDCMQDKGINVDFDKQYSARQSSNGPLQMDKEQMENLQEIETQLSGAAPPPMAPAPMAAAPSGAPLMTPPPVAAVPAPAPVAPAPVKAEDSEPIPPKKVRQPRKYWVDTE
jgi:hypothetical protein